MTESIDELKERLSSMKRLMEERKAKGSREGKDMLQGHSQSLKGASIIDGNFLAFVFGSSLLIIISVSIYAFYNLYTAVLKKFPSTHTEL